VQVNSLIELLCREAHDYKCLVRLLSAADWWQNGYLVAVFELCLEVAQGGDALTVDQEMQMSMHVAQLVIEVVAKLFSVFLGQMLQK